MAATMTVRPIVVPAGQVPTLPRRDLASESRGETLPPSALLSLSLLRHVVGTFSRPSSSQRLWHRILQLEHEVIQCKTLSPYFL